MSAAWLVGAGQANVEGACSGDARDARHGHMKQVAAARGVRPGDLVVSPIGATGRIALGRATRSSGCQAAGVEEQDMIPLRWLRVLDRTAVRGDLLCGLNGSGTVFRAKRFDAVRRLERLAATGTDPGPRWPRPKVGPPPPRVTLNARRRTMQLDLVMSEYSAIRGEIEATLNNQVAILSFGSATVGLLVAAAAALWKDQTALTGLILLVGVPLVSFLTLAVYSGELVRLMRAGLFLNFLELSVNSAFLRADDESGKPRTPFEEPRTVLTWERWSNIRQGGGDVDRLNRLAISAVFVVLAIGFSLAGYQRLQSAPDIRDFYAYLGLAASLAFGVISILWLTYLTVFAYSYRGLYNYTIE